MDDGLVFRLANLSRSFRFTLESGVRLYRPRMDSRTWLLSEVSYPIHLACTTCTETCGNGVEMDTRRVIMRSDPKTPLVWRIPSASRMKIYSSFVAAVL